MIPVPMNRIVVKEGHEDHMNEASRSFRKVLRPIVKSIIEDQGARILVNVARDRRKYGIADKFYAIGIKQNQIDAIEKLGLKVSTGDLGLRVFYPNQI